MIMMICSKLYQKYGCNQDGEDDEDDVDEDDGEGGGGGEQTKHDALRSANRINATPSRFTLQYLLKNLLLSPCIALHCIELCNA